MKYSHKQITSEQFPAERRSAPAAMRVHGAARSATRSGKRAEIIAIFINSAPAPSHTYLDAVISLCPKLPSGASTGTKPQWSLYNTKLGFLRLSAKLILILELPKIHQLTKQIIRAWAVWINLLALLPNPN